MSIGKHTFSRVAPKLLNSFLLFYLDKNLNILNFFDKNISDQNNHLWYLPGRSFLHLPNLEMSCLSILLILFFSRLSPIIFFTSHELCVSLDDTILSFSNGCFLYVPCPDTSFRKYFPFPSWSKMKYGPIHLGSSFVKMQMLRFFFIP